MIWQDQGYLLSKIKFRENANIINVFTNNLGKVSGIVYGGNSRKIRNFLQIPNKIFVFNTTKGENKIGYFKTELVEAISPKYFNDKKKTSALLSISSTLENLFKSFNEKNWIINYIFWELNLLKELGFDPYLNQFANNINQNNIQEIIEIDNIKYQVPIFLINKNNKITPDNKAISTGLRFTRNILTNKFFLPTNLIFPKSRIILENYFN